MSWAKADFAQEAARECARSHRCPQPTGLATAARFAGLLLAGLLSASCTPPTLPNVLLVTFDTTRYDRFGCTGDPEARTPVVDELASRGLLFERAYASVSLTLPSHTTMLTGLEPLTHGVHNNGKFRVPEELVTLPEILQQEGYTTAAFVSAFVLDKRYKLNQGFEVYSADVERSNDPLSMTVAQRRGAEVTDEALQWLEQRRRDAPYFLWAHYYDPHSPHDPEPPFDARPDLYRAEISYADQQLGRLLEGIASDSGGRDTLIVFTGDHGESLGEHGESTHGIVAYDSTLHVPLILSGPGVPAGERSDALARHVDLLPTILEALGLTGTDSLPGRDLLGAPGDEPALGYFESRGPEIDLGWAPIDGVRTARWKYTALPLPEELYDVKSDPDEMQNLARERPEVLARMQAARETLHSEQANPDVASRIQDLDPEESEQLAALGYVDAAASFAPGEQPDPRRFVGAHGWVDAGRGLARKGHYEKAIDMLETLVESPSVRPLVLRTLAPVYAEAGRLEDAIRAYHLYIELTGASEARLGLARTLLRAARPEEALAVIDEVSGQSVRTEMLRAQALALLGRHAEARSAVDASFQRGNSLQRLHTRAHIALFVAPIPDGEHELRDLLSQAPEDALLLSRLGFYLAVWGRDDQREEAMSMLRDAAANQPDAAEIQSNLGWGGYQSGLYDQAVEALEVALGIDENRHQDRARLARALAAAGEPRRAIGLLRAAVKARPSAQWSDDARALLEELEAEVTRSSSVGADS